MVVLLTAARQRCIPAATLSCKLFPPSASAEEE
jgi:hypothetical protein